MLWLLVAVILLIIGYIKLYKPHQYWKERNVPHMKPWPLVGNMLPYFLGRIDMPAWYQSLYKACSSRYIGYYQFLRPALLIKDTELIKLVTIKDFDHFVDHESFFNASEDPVFEKNLFALTGQDWRDMRVALSPAFSGSKMRAMFTLISECAHQFTQHFAKQAHPNKPMSMEMENAFQKYTTNVIATCAFGIECDSLNDDNNEFYLKGKELSTSDQIRALKSLGFMICPKIMNFFKLRLFSEESINFFRNIVTETIAYREKNGIIRPDMIHLMMEARKGRLFHEESVKYSDAGFATVEESDVGTNKNINKIEITDDIITAQAMVFFLGGAETVATSCSFVSYELAVNEEVQRKLQAEIDENYDECNGKISYERMQKMKYLDMVVSETLRKWPIGYFLNRLCVKPYTIQPTNPDEDVLELEKGDLVIIPVIGMHRDPEFYPDPERFDPERFSDENKGNIQPYSYYPFGVGPRSCIANRFALMETKVIFFHLLRKFDIVVVEKTDIPLRLSKKQIIMHAVNGFWLGLKLRSD